MSIIMLVFEVLKNLRSSGLAKKHLSYRNFFQLDRFLITTSAPSSARRELSEKYPQAQVSSDLNLDTKTTQVTVVFVVCFKPGHDYTFLKALGELTPIIFFSWPSFGFLGQQCSFLVVTLSILHQSRWNRYGWIQQVQSFQKSIIKLWFEESWASPRTFPRITVVFVEGPDLIRT